jgi:APA family basic amino acid/polyamine antiporter
LVLFSFGAIIGTGIFTLTGPAAHLAGSSVIIAYFFTGLVAMATAIVFAEFSSIIPKSGSTYLYSYCIFGEFTAWIIAWNYAITYVFGNAVGVRGLASYTHKLFKIFGVTCLDPLFDYKAGGVNLCPFASIILLICVLIQNRGTKESGFMNNILNGFKIILITFVIIISFCMWETKYLTPFTIKDEGYLGIIKASTTLYYTYLGFEYTTILCDEALEPKRDVPKGIKWSVSLIIGIYTIFALALSGVGNLSTTKDGGKTAVVDVFHERG